MLPIRDPEALGIRTGEVGKFEGPGWNAWFGGDSQGRDLFARVVEGARPALLLGTAVTVLGGFIGTAIGLAAGYLRGRVDAIATVLIDIALAFPALVLLIAVRASYGNSMVVFITLFSILSVPSYARIVRGASFSLSERQFVDAAASMGASRARILWRELAPNIVRPVAAFAFIGFALVIVAEGGLAFIGLSLDEVTWGRLIADGAGEIDRNPHLALIPATVMFLTILSFNLVGDGLQATFATREVATRRQLRVDGPPAAGAANLAAALRIVDLRTTLHTPAGDVRAVDGVTLSVRAGEVLAIVGESGSGKTMILRSIVGAFPLADVTCSGSVEVGGTDMLRAPRSEISRTLGTTIGIVSQNPLTALNPVRRIGTQIAEPMIVHGGLSKAAARDRALDLMRQVGIPAPRERLREYPHQLSGGMRQRVTIAIALANHPALLLADEPTTALDVTVQDQILRLLSDLQRDNAMAMVLVTHDLSVVHGDRRPGGDRLRRGDRGERAHAGDLRSPPAPVHRRPDAFDAEPGPPAPLGADEHRRHPAPPRRPSRRLSVRAAVSAATERCRSIVPEARGTDERWYRCHHPLDDEADGVAPVALGVSRGVG